jgi:hypothetical protein
MTQPEAVDTVVQAVAQWAGVSVANEEEGEIGFRMGGREIGHLHGSRLAHSSFPHGLWDELREAGRIEPHPVFPGKRGPAQRRITSDDDVRDVIALLRVNYDRARSRAGSRPEAVSSEAVSSDAV